MPTKQKTKEVFSFKKQKLVRVPLKKAREVVATGTKGLRVGSDTRDTLYAATYADVEGS